MGKIERLSQRHLQIAAAKLEFLADILLITEEKEFFDGELALVEHAEEGFAQQRCQTGNGNVYYLVHKELISSSYT